MTTAETNAQQYHKGPIKEKIEIIPPSPEAASLGKYGDIPVGYYTGAVNLSVPIAEIKSGSLKIPVSLNYSSGSGIQVSEVANNIGLGWQLSAANVITRAVFSKPDDQGGFLTTIATYTPADLNELQPGATASQMINSLQFVYKAATSCMDFQPDLFYYNFNGYSGKFYFDWNGKIINVSSSPIKISYTTAASGIQEWVITTETGVKYTFSTTERTIASSPVANPDLICNNNDQDYFPSWHLAKIEDLNGNTISFGYEMYSYSMINQTSQQVEAVLSHPIGQCLNASNNWDAYFPIGITNNGPTYSGRLLRHFQERLKTITSSDGGKITFNYLTTRQDNAGLIEVTNFKSLDNITYSYGGAILKQWDLQHDYTTGRLTLKKVTEKSGPGQVDNTYSFAYTGSIPESIHSYALDHWGFYNAKDNNPSLVPSLMETVYAQTNPVSVYYAGADREVDTVASIQGLLNKITYPTGGTTEFTYEAHDCGMVNDKTVTSFNLHPKHWAYPTALVYAVTPGITRQIERDTFVVPVTTQVRVDYDAFINSDCDFNRKPLMKLSSIAGGQETIIKQKNLSYSDGAPWVGGYHFDETIELPAGTYVIQAEAQCYGDQPDFASITVIYEFTETNITLNKLAVGGARVKEIRTKDPYNNVMETKTFSYNLPDAPSGSSGVIYAIPNYHYYAGEGYMLTTECDPGNSPILETTKSINLSNNTYQLGNTSGSHIGYQYVTIAESGKGKQELHFTSPAQYPDFIATDHPFVPATSQSYKTGLLLDEKNYKAQPGGFSLVNRKQKEYNFIDTAELVHGVFFTGNTGMVTGLHTNAGETQDHYYHKVFQFFAFREFNHTSGYPRLISETETDYIPEAVTIAVNKNYHPVVKQLAQKETTVNSDGKQTATTYSYPFDEPASPVISAMLDKNMIAAPTATQTFVNNNLVSTAKNTFSLTGSNQVELYKKETSTYNNPLETEITYDKYDTKGHLLRYTLRGGNSGAILWGYDNSYPVAELQNINANALDAYLSSNPSVQAVLNTPSNDQALHNAIQQLRTAFPEARVTGYAYQPLIGMTSKSDINNTMTWFEYDAMGRLARIKDQNGNILKQNSYQYQVTE